MQIRFSTLFFAMLFVCGVIACANQTGPLRAATVGGQAVITAADVEEVYLKFDSRDQRYFAVLELNAAGKGRMGSLLGGAGGSELRLFAGQRLLMSVPIMTDRIDRLLIKFDDGQSAIRMLKDLSD